LLVAESVELATVLLTDLVGSTRLATSVGPVRADQLREEHFELLRDAIASSGGREVKNIGDGLMVVFSSASAAVECAVAIQQLFERRYRDAEQALHVRVGLGAGESTVKDGDYFGMPTVMAARLCAEAPADGILVSAGVKMFAGRCEGVEFGSVGELELKGFSEPVEAFSVLWVPLSDEAREAGEVGRWPLPALLRSVPPLAYVGRVAERALLEGALTEVREGARRVVLLSGEPGIGKTRLASYLAHRAHAEGFAVAWGTCSEELAVPYEPWIGVCSQLVEYAPQEFIESHVRRHGGELCRLARNLPERVSGLPEPQSSDPETERYLLFSAVVGLLEELGRSVPLCVVLDDLHWADAQSVALLKHLGRSVEQGALQVIATYRDSDLGKDHPLTGALADLRAVEGVQRISLRGLDTHEVADMVTSAAGHELDEDGVELAAEIAQETDGNPFFVAEILRSLLEAGALVLDESTRRWSVDRAGGITLPESVREVIERRVERLDPQAAEVLRQAAVIGRVFNVELLSATSDVTEGRLLDHLENAVAASLLSESTVRVGEFRFAHALMNQTLYEGLGATRRARTHQRVAQALEKLYGDDPGEHLTELALHWRLAAVSVDKAKAADYALKAGQRALQSLAPDEAVKLFTDALDLTGAGDSVERSEALIGLGEAQRQVGGGSHRETLLEACEIALRLGDADRLARAALSNSIFLWSVWGGMDEEVVAALQAAADQLPSDSPQRARVLGQLALELTFAPDFDSRVRPLIDESLALARAAEDRRVLADVLASVSGAMLGRPDLMDERLALADEMRSVVEEVADPVPKFLAAWWRFPVALERGDIDELDTNIAQMRRLNPELGQLLLRAYTSFCACTRAQIAGDLEQAEAQAVEFVTYGTEAVHRDALTGFGAELGVIRAEQGRLDEIVEIYAQRARENPGMPMLQAVLAFYYSELGRLDEARAALDAAAPDGFAVLPHDVLRLMALSRYGQIAFRTGAAAHAETLYDLLYPYRDHLINSFVTVFGSGHMILGLLATGLDRYDAAEQHFEEASSVHERIGAPLFLARTWLYWGQMLTRRDEPGDWAHAQSLLERAESHAQAHGGVAIKREAQALAQQAPT
jgi:class 3 adenylate cyclase/tetratricopeptide (TPR) repeat protein